MNESNRSAVGVDGEIQDARHQILGAIATHKNERRKLEGDIAAQQEVVAATEKPYRAAVEVLDVLNDAYRTAELRETNKHIELGPLGEAYLDDTIRQIEWALNDPSGQNKDRLQVALETAQGWRLARVTAQEQIDRIDALKASL